MSRPALEGLEAADFEPRSGELLVSLAWLVSESVPIEEDELKAARRRAMFVLAAGGDPHRELDLNSVAAERLAGELDLYNAHQVRETLLACSSESPAKLVVLAMRTFWQTWVNGLQPTPRTRSQALSVSAQDSPGPALAAQTFDLQ